MNRQIIIFTITILAIALVGWGLFLPSLNSVFESMATLKAEQAKLAEADAAKQKLSDLQKKDVLSESNYQRVTEAITLTEDLPGLLVQLEALASQNGLILDRVALTPANEKKSKSVSQSASQETEQAGSPVSPSQGGLKTSEVLVGLSGDFSSLRNFLEVVENNLRLMDVSSVSLSDTASVGGREFLPSYEVRMNVYHKTIN